MARFARVVVPGLPHHVTQRGNRRQQTFFSDTDYRLYRRLMAEWCGRRGVAIWAYCLMPNHVHLIAVPDAPESLGAAIGEAHRRYSWLINRREDWRGYLFQGRFASFPMDEPHLLMAARYIELNPVRAGLTPRPRDWPWSSARAHLAGRDDELVAATPLLERVGDWRGFLQANPADPAFEAMRRHARTGRPLGAPDFVARLESQLGRTLRRGRPGPKPAADAAATR